MFPDRTMIHPSTNTTEGETNELIKIRANA